MNMTMKNLTAVASFFLLALDFDVHAQMPPPAPVRIESGMVQGTFEDGLTVYRGIPFAAPPTGDLRWRAPQSAAKWEGMRQATQFGSMPVQGGKGSEDCLYLNVWTPAKSASDRIPVLVWIYGGGFSAGSTSDPNYSGEQLAKKGVVFVSIAYRVGLLGLPRLSPCARPRHVGQGFQSGAVRPAAGTQDPAHL
jgi:para-nitrobenzyl esterase